MSLSTLVLLAGQFTSRVPFYQILNPIVISAPRAQPPMQALVSVLQGTVTEYKMARLDLNNSEISQQRSIYIGDDQLLLNKMIFAKSELSLNNKTWDGDTQVAESKSDSDWVNSLSPANKIRLEYAEKENLLGEIDGLEENSYRAQVDKILKNTILEKNQNLQRWSGKIEITGGLAMTPDTHLEVHHIRDGIIQDSAAVDFPSGTYAFSSRPRGGAIVARLKDKTGHIRGEKRKQLPPEDPTEVPSSGDLSPSAAGVAPDMSLAPQPGFLAIVNSIYAGKQKINASILRGEHEMQGKMGEVLQFDQVESGSQTEILVSAADHQSTRALLTAGSQAEIPMLPRKWIRALRQVVLDEEPEKIEESKGMIFGRVKSDGKPLAGMTVRLDEYPNLRPVYLNELFLPDKNLKGTDRSGYFVFLDAPEGSLSILAENSSKTVQIVQNFVAAEDVTSFLDLETSAKSAKTMLRSYDALTGEEQNAEIEFPAQDPPMKLMGEAKLSLPQVEKWGEVFVQPESNEYAEAFYQYNQVDDHIHFPLLARSWLANIDQTSRSQPPGEEGGTSSLGFTRNSTVGYVFDEEFTVYVAGHPEIKAIYFDSKGNATQGAHGPARGGFVVSNLPEGHQQIIVIKENSKNLNSRIIHTSQGKNTVLFF